MSWLKRLFGKGRHIVTDEERDKSAIVKKVNAIRRKRLELLEDQLAHLQQMQQEQQIQDEIAQIQDAMYGEDEDEDEDEQSVEKMLLGMFGKMIDKKKAPEQSASVNLSDAEIKARIREIPANQLAIAKKASPSQIRDFLQERYPELDEDTQERAIKLVKA